MRIKQKMYCGIIGAVSLSISPSVFAAYTVLGTGSLTITAPGYNGANGTGDQAGPYQVSSLSLATGPNPGSSFETFCLGTQIDYYPGSTYNYEISDTVQPQGLAPSGVGAPGYVTWGTAYLYSQFRSGAYASVFDLGPGLINNEKTDAFQAAIWTLQMQTFTGGIVSFGTADPLGPATADIQYFLNLASSAAPSGGDGIDANGAFGVYAMNMLSGPGAYVQPQLCMVPVPEGSPVVPEPATWLAGLLVLLPSGVNTLRIARKRLA